MSRNLTNDIITAYWPDENTIVGNTLIGEFRGVHEKEHSKYDENRVAKIFEPIGEVIIAVNFTWLVKQVIEEMKEGDFVKFTFTGTKQLKGDRKPMKLFKIEILDDKEYKEYLKENHIG